MIVCTCTVFAIIQIGMSKVAEHNINLQFSHSIFYGKLQLAVLIFDFRSTVDSVTLREAATLSLCERTTYRIEMLQLNTYTKVTKKILNSTRSAACVTLKAIITTQMSTIIKTTVMTVCVCVCQRKSANESKKFEMFEATRSVAVNVRIAQR